MFRNDDDDDVAMVIHRYTCLYRHEVVQRCLSFFQLCINWKFKYRYRHAATKVGQLSI